MRHPPSLLALPLILVACAWQGPMPLEAGADSQESPLVVALDEEVWRAVELQGLTTKEYPGGIRVVRVTIGNATDGDHNVELRVLFADERGVLVGTDPPWQTLLVPRAAFTLYEAHSDGPATRFRVELRSP
jgi:hypothetical protein